STPQRVGTSTWPKPGTCAWPLTNGSRASDGFCSRNGRVSSVVAGRMGSGLSMATRLRQGQDPRPTQHLLDQFREQNYLRHAVTSREHLDAEAPRPSHRVSSLPALTPGPARLSPSSTQRPTSRWPTHSKRPPPLGGRRALARRSGAAGQVSPVLRPCPH